MTEQYLLEKVYHQSNNTNRSYCCYGAPLIIARPSNIVGHSELGTRVPGNLFWPFRAAWLLGRHTWHHSRYIDVVPVDWVADTLLTLLTSSNDEFSNHSKVFHLSAGLENASRWQTLFERMQQGYTNDSSTISSSYEQRLFSTMNEALSIKALLNDKDSMTTLHDLDERQLATLMRAMRLYYPYASANIAFDNRRLLQTYRGAIRSPPSFSDDYIQQCIASSRPFSFWQQFQID